jgi:4-hydroxy-4-methyl-2-oxoglutarate aldolase
MTPEDEARRDAAVQLTSSALGDARGKRGHLPAAIRRLLGEGVFAGLAVTARCTEGSGSAMLRAVSRLQPGDVLVIQGSAEYAYIGELGAAEAVRRGVVAIVADAFIRDLERMSTLGIPVHAHGTTPRGADTGTGEIDVTLEIGSTTVRPGDWIVGDRDGLVVVPPEEMDQALKRAGEIEQDESGVWERVRSGEALADQPGKYGEGIRAMMSEVDA